ncbi:alpha/beta hydrolase YcfP [Vibrio hannami]|uniref:alpha/beta hydrolase YcfP n=1 Tax=Vibrio hannami TaxID=2717094 RepID=UPI002410ABEE|nr:alpha/beta hydrolase YcfP [Vibrio hannami]MDG3088412.1 alpha/beta hydrolase YcfP [Vibrio hannami]
MIIYLHGFDSSSPGNHEKVLQLQFIDEDVRFINYSTLHPKHDMQHLLKEVNKVVEQSDDPNPIICGVGLGGYWSERVGFLCGIKQVIFNPNLHPESNMEGKIDRPEEYEDIATKCVSQFRTKNKGRCLAILSKSDDVLDNQQTASELQDYYEIVWDETQEHKFKKISQHLQKMKAFKEQEPEALSE